jgi:hypothetical protein
MKRSEPLERAGRVRVFSGRVPIDRMRKAQRYFGTRQPGVAIARAIDLAAEAQELAEALESSGGLRRTDFDERLL